MSWFLCDHSLCWTVHCNSFINNTKSTVSSSWCWKRVIFPCSKMLHAVPFFAQVITTYSKMNSSAEIHVIAFVYGYVFFTATSTCVVHMTAIRQYRRPGTNSVWGICALLVWTNMPFKPIHSVQTSLERTQGYTSIAALFSWIFL